MKFAQFALRPKGFSIRRRRARDRLRRCDHSIEIEVATQANLSRATSGRAVGARANRQPRVQSRHCANTISLRSMCSEAFAHEALLPARDRLLPARDRLLQTESRGDEPSTIRVYFACDRTRRSTQKGSSARSWSSASLQCSRTPANVLRWCTQGPYF